mmetsp:Transcript_39878/g.127519  ORF Transcript_39878/g.127519 Transcript_39878/m.127519 type:complete len:414 (-) Transcript_39878:45-1286(-)
MYYINGILGAPLLEEVIALVVHHDEGGEVLHLDPPHRLHSKLRVFKHVDLLDVVLGQDGRGAADRPKVEPPVGLARPGDGPRPVSLGEHDHAPPCRLKRVHVRVHAPRGGGPERPRGHARGSLGGAGVVNGVVFHILREALAGVQTFLQLRVRDVARHDEGASERQAGLDGVLGELRENLLHRFVEVHLHHVRTERVLGHVGKVLRGLGLELLDEHAVFGNLANRLAVGRAGDAEPDGAARTVARQPYHAHVMAEIFPSELRPDAHLLGELMDLRLPFQVPEGAPMHVPAGVQVVVVARRGHLDRLEVVLRAQAADDHREVVGRTRGSPEGLDLLVEKLDELRGVEQRFGLLKQEGLVRRAAACRGSNQKLQCRGSNQKPSVQTVEAKLVHAWNPTLNPKPMEAQYDAHSSRG